MVTAAADAIEELTEDNAALNGTVANLLEQIKDLASPRWIPVTSRPMTEEERQEYSQYYGDLLSDDEAVIYTSLPADGQEVLTCDRYGAIDKDVFVNDGDGCYFEGNGEMDGIVAWMPLPEPPKEVEGGRRMSDLDIAKHIIKKHYKCADCGLFDTRNIVGDPMTPLYDNGRLKIDICYRYGYYEVLGLTDADFTELENYYCGLGENDPTIIEAEGEE